ncbi:MAG: copper chaperone PCu(A)C [Luteimonas sp.]
MNMMKAVFAGVLVLLAGSTRAGECLPRLRDGWIRLAPGAMAMPMLAGFGRIENPCTSAMAVVGASSPAFGDVSLHRTSTMGGVSRMRLVPELTIEAGSTEVLEPGGLHLMLMQPVSPIKAGVKIPVTFRLKDGREVSGELVARGAAP